VASQALVASVGSKLFVVSTEVFDVDLSCARTGAEKIKQQKIAAKVIRKNMRDEIAKFAAK
jgi:hypothetical protein